MRLLLQFRLAELKWTGEEAFANAVARSKDRRVYQLLLTIVREEYLYQSASIYREALQVLGYLGGKEAVETLLNVAVMNLRLMPFEIGTALSVVRDPSTVGQLIEGLTSDIPLSAKASIAFALGQIRDPKAIPGLLNVLDSNVSELTTQAIAALGSLKEPAVVPILIDAVDKFYFADPFEVVRTLRKVNLPETAALLLARIQSGSLEQQAAGLELAGHIRLKDVIPTIMDYLHHSSDELRQRAARALGNFRAEIPEAKEPLLNLLEEDAVDSVRADAAYALKHYHDSSTIDALVRALHDPSPQVRQYAIHSLSFMGAKETSNRLLQVVQEDQDKLTRHAAIGALGDMKIESAVPHLISLLNAGTDFHVIEALGRIGTDEAVEALLAAFDQAHGDEYRVKIIQALIKTPNRRAKPLVVRAFRDPYARVRSAAVYALQNFRDPDTLPLLLEALDDPDPAVRFGAVCRVRERDDSAPAIPQLIAVMQSDDPYSYTWRFEKVPVELPLSMAAALTLKNYDDPVAQSALADWLQDHVLPDFTEFEDYYNE